MEKHNITLCITNLLLPDSLQCSKHLCEVRICVPPLLWENRANAPYPITQPVKVEQAWGVLVTFRIREAFPSLTLHGFFCLPGPQPTQECGVSILWQGQSWNSPWFVTSSLSGLSSCYQWDRERGIPQTEPPGNPSTLISLPYLFQSLGNLRFSADSPNHWTVAPGQEYKRGST